MRFGFPVSLELSGRRAVVIGGTAVALEKPLGLMEAGARVTVIATRPRIAIESLQADPRAQVLEREYRAGDLAGAFIAIASSDDPAELDSICAEAREHRTLLNVIDGSPRCDWAAPAIVRRGDLSVAVATGGASPALARKLREEFEERLGPEWAEVVDLIRAVRNGTAPLLPDLHDRGRRWNVALDPQEIARMVREDRGEEAREMLRERILARVEAEARP